jgi:hypothetical protein
MGVYPFFRPLDFNNGPLAQIEGREVIMLGSNNYLGLTTDPRVRQAARGNFLQRIFRRNTMKGDAGLTELLVPVRRTWVIDLSINTTQYAIPMGEPGSSWAYTVPYVGMDLPTGIDKSTSQMTYRKANENDARMYPRRRLVISKPHR